MCATFVPELWGALITGETAFQLQILARHRISCTSLQCPGHCLEAEHRWWTGCKTNAMRFALWRSWSNFVFSATKTVSKGQLEASLPFSLQYSTQFYRFNCTFHIQFISVTYVYRWDFNLPSDFQALESKNCVILGKMTWAPRIIFIIPSPIPVHQHFFCIDPVASIGSDFL